MDSLERTARDIRSMKVRGALDISVAAVEAMGSVAQKDYSSSAELLSALRSAGKKLKETRPSAVSLPNAVNYVLYVAEKNKGRTLPQFRKAVLAETKSFVATQKMALKKIADIGSNLLESGDVVLTHCNSDTVIETLKKAHDKGKDIEVVCTETRPRNQGYLTAKALSSHGIKTTLIIDSAVHLMMQKMRVNKVLVGADTICANGDVVNKIGTSQIALCAKEMGIDFIVATESIKFSPESIMGSVVKIEERDPLEIVTKLKLHRANIRNPAFDVTDSDHVDMMVTEYGVIPPQAAYTILREKFGWEIPL